MAIARLRFDTSFNDKEGPRQGYLAQHFETRRKKYSFAKAEILADHKELLKLYNERHFIETDDDEPSPAEVSFVSSWSNKQLENLSTDHCHIAVISSNRSQFMRTHISRLFYNPEKVGERKVLVFVHIREFFGYKQRLSGLRNLCVIGHNVQKSVGVGFGAARMAAHHILSTLKVHRAWMVDDNVTPIFCEAPLTQAQVLTSIESHRSPDRTSPIAISFEFGEVFTSPKDVDNVEGIEGEPVKKLENLEHIEFVEIQAGEKLFPQVLVLLRLSSLDEKSVSYSAVFAGSKEDMAFNTMLHHHFTKPVCFVRSLKQSPIVHKLKVDDHDSTNWCFWQAAFSAPGTSFSFKCQENQQMSLSKFVTRQASKHNLQEPAQRLETLAVDAIHYAAVKRWKSCYLRKSTVVCHNSDLSPTPTSLQDVSETLSACGTKALQFVLHIRIAQDDDDDQVSAEVKDCLETPVVPFVYSFPEIVKIKLNEQNIQSFHTHFMHNQLYTPTHQELIASLLTQQQPFNRTVYVTVARVDVRFVNMPPHLVAKFRTRPFSEAVGLAIQFKRLRVLVSIHVDLERTLDLHALSNSALPQPGQWTSLTSFKVSSLDIRQDLDSLKSLADTFSSGDALNHWLKEESQDCTQSPISLSVVIAAARRIE